MIKVKNILIIWGILSVLLSLPSAYAEDKKNIVQESWTVIADDVMASVDPNVMEDMYKIAVHYCNDEIQGDKINSYLTIQMRPGSSKQLCITMANASASDQDLTLWFTESLINEVGKQLCQWDLADKNNNFHKYITLENADLHLPGSGWTFTQIANIRIPKSTATWDMYWCLWFFLSGAYFKWPNDVLGVRMARHFPLKIVITGDVYNYGRRDDIKYAYTDNRQTILKIIMGILAIRLVWTIVNTTKKTSETKQKRK